MALKTGNGAILAQHCKAYLNQEGHSPAIAESNNTTKDVASSNPNCWEQVQNPKPQCLLSRRCNVINEWP